MTLLLRQEYLICYDIEDNKKRRRVFKELKQTGMMNAQKSVFWGYLTKAELNAIRRMIAKEIGKEDKALITRTNFNGRGFSFLFGHTEGEFQDWKECYVI